METQKEIDHSPNNFSRHLQRTSNGYCFGNRRRAKQRFRKLNPRFVFVVCIAVPLQLKKQLTLWPDKGFLKQSFEAHTITQSVHDAKVGTINVLWFCQECCSNLLSWTLNPDVPILNDSFLKFGPVDEITSSLSNLNSSIWKLYVLITNLRLCLFFYLWANLFSFLTKNG